VKKRCDEIGEERMVPAKSGEERNESGLGNVYENNAKSNKPSA
jgi:hypothetical protein